jgi:protein involved in polysaccharide export with SLBB domain
LGLDLEDALASPGSAADLLLLPGDSLEVPQFDGTVQILGAVEFQSRTRWQEGMSLGDYLDQAGGVVEDGDRNRAVVTYANQERQRSRKFLIFRSDPRVEPGSTISVPFRNRGKEVASTRTNFLLVSPASLRWSSCSTSSRIDLLFARMSLEKSCT